MEDVTTFDLHGWSLAKTLCVAKTAIIISCLSSGWVRIFLYTFRMQAWQAVLLVLEATAEMSTLEFLVAAFIH